MIASILRPSILAGMALGGLVETAILSIDATIKAVRVCDDKGIDIKKEPKKALYETRKLWVLPCMSLIGTGTCVLGLYGSLSKEVSGIAAAYSMAGIKYGQRIAAERKVLGDKAKDIDRYIQDEKFSSPVPSTPPADGLMWCYEPESEQWFQATTQAILYAEIVANKMFANHGELRFNDFLSLLPGCKSVPWGKHFGWFRYDDDGYWDFNWSFYPGGTPWIDIQPQLDTERGVLIINYGMHPGDDMDCKDIDEPEQFVEEEIEPGLVYGRF